MKIVTDAGMWDIRIPNGMVYTHSLSQNRALASLAIRGEGAFSLDANDPTRFAHIEAKDCEILLLNYHENKLL